jgi:hypothetical protein
MRVQTYALGISMAIGATVAGFAGCGGSVNQTTSASTGGGGHQTSTVTGTATGTSVTVTTSTVSATSTTASSSSGGGTPCDMGCAHAKMCGFDICTMLGINCATVGTMYDCVFNCTNPESCSQLTNGGALACYQMCQGMMGDGGTGDGGSGMACAQCAGMQGNCQSQIGACAQDPTMKCQPWLQCAGACNQQMMPPPSCFAACDAMYASEKSLYAPIYACACSKCPNECASSNPCAYGMDGGP